MVKIGLFVSVHVEPLFEDRHFEHWIPKSKLRVYGYRCLHGVVRWHVLWSGQRGLRLIFICLNQGAYFIRQMSVHGRELHPLPREGVTDVPTDGWNEERVA